LKAISGRILIWLLSRLRETDDVKEGNLNTSVGTEVILLLFKDKKTVEAKGKLKAPEVIFAIKLLDKLTTIYVPRVKLKAPDGYMVGT